MNDPMINLNDRLTVRMTQIVALELSPLYPSVFVHLCSGQRFELNETRYEDAVALYKRLQSLIQPAPKRSCLFPVTTPASDKATNALTRSNSPFTGEFKTRLKTLVDNERFDELERALDCVRNSFGRC
ncbi:hypothetical protein ORB76_000805 [Salmonella enterica]|nr:hypothetical protein [Salmonella enterica subsp. enterica serovar Sundsvall]EKD3156646.1 hypothetical protein [Salmonella enterica]